MGFTLTVRCKDDPCGNGTRIYDLRVAHAKQLNEVWSMVNNYRLASLENLRSSLQKGEF